MLKRILLLFIVWLTAVGARAAAVSGDTLSVDTLREVVVDGEQGLPVEQQFRRDVQRNRQPRMKTLGDLLPRSLQDKILHPFAIGERRKERRRKKAQRVMEEYDRRKADQDLFEEVVRRQREEDERNGMTNWQQLK